MNVMTDLEAAWVREHVWTRTMRETFALTPAFYLTCYCQRRECGACERGRHDRCLLRQYEPFPTYECCITDRNQCVVGFPDRYEHPTRNASGAHRAGAAMVWLADRRCIWRCTCECRADEPARPQPIVLVPNRPSRRRELAGQEALFGVMSHG